MDREGQKLDSPRELSWIAPDPAIDPVRLAPGGAVVRLNGPLSTETCRPENRLQIEDYQPFVEFRTSGSAKSPN